MRMGALEAILQRGLLALVLACGVPAAAQDAGDAVGDDATTDTERAMRDAIDRIESRQGAYGAGLPEQMLSLGLALQQQERHGEAVALFKRGVHLARINNGLYCTEQIPLLQGEIQSAIALGNYSRVDELQEYLYRVQVRSLASGEERANALLQQATWQFNAYQLGLGTRGPDRLLTMWDLYRTAWSDINDTEGETSTKLLPPLYGLLRTQYLLSEYRPETEPFGNSYNPGYSNADANRFYVYRSENYNLGRNVILSIYNIQRSNKGQDSDEAIGAIVTLGDWALWNNMRDEATQTYRQALGELAQRDDAQEGEQQLFTEPVPLPDIAGLRALPRAVSAEQGKLLVEFGVDSQGKVVDLVRLDDNEELDVKAGRLMRVLRKTQFRPRFVAGDPVDTEKLVRAYDIKP